jgi:hypothetical protein
MARSAPTPTVSRRQLLAGTMGALGVHVVTSGPAAASTSATADHAALETFDYAGVRLLPSRWKAQQDEVADDFARVPSDNYLRGFRIRAGLPAPGEELGGWYSDDIFHNFGQIVSGLARFHAGSGRTDLAEKVAELVTGFAECIEPDGYFFYTRHPNSPHYVYEKVVCGLLDAWLYCGVTDALPALERVTAWALDPAHLGRVREHGGGWEGEWYTLSENLYRAYLATGDTTYRDFAQVWEYRSLWDRFYAGEDYFQTPDGQPVAAYHAYSHVNSLSGLGAGYRVTGDEYYLTALRNAYDVIRVTQCWATGGYGPFEQLLPERAAIAATLEPWHNHFETQCGSWAALKVSKYLVTATGEARYGDWAEQMLYNGVGASIGMSPDGRVQYYSAYSPRGGRKVNSAPWSCCTGTRSQGVADYTDQVFLRGDRKLLVNLFLPARVEWPTDEGLLVARVVTRFPTEDRVRLVVDAAPHVPFTLGFRVPGWVAGRPRLTVNGRGSKAAPDAHGWMTATRTWRPGDEVAVDLPMALRVHRVLEDQAAPAAVTYGPVSVAYAGTRNPVADMGPEQLVARSRRHRQDELSWQVAGTSLKARPYFAFGPGERYFLHLDPDAGLYIGLDGDWGSLPFVSVTSYPGDTATCEFEGTGVRVAWFELDSAGIVEVDVDGEPALEIDQYGPANGTIRETAVTDLPRGRHTVVLRNSGRKNPLSTGIGINVIDITLDGPAETKARSRRALTAAEQATVRALARGEGVR